jgi:protein-disulfide isomerase
MIARIFVVLVLLAGMAGIASAQEGVPFNNRQMQGIQQIVRAYLMEHPEVITDAIEALREKMRIQARADAKKAILAYKGDLFDDKNDPTAGNPKGDVTIVEFFDYNCVYCRASTNALLNAVNADGRVKVVFKELPILTQGSVVAARMALAAMKQGKYDALHKAFMNVRGLLDDKLAYQIAAKTGLNMERLKRDMASPQVAKDIRRNKELAHALDIGGTPTFVIGDRIISEALDEPVFRQLFAAARTTDKERQH